MFVTYFVFLVMIDYCPKQMPMQHTTHMFG